MRLKEYEANVPVLEKARAELKKWKTKEPVILHYLHVFQDMAK